ncbi:hypothetical protein QNO07_15745 [Streptomyces sp. 549]|uniref:hypothetical protein n=1 Tax=Streptomyces sp. 549 TaxID=3049076 RepID=UPI0024C30A61|nr:hypothetical protein [Streptomyces sp. 549]MDK1474855.1 hypothetical protein [Streptomyces sp. 549]
MTGDDVDRVRTLLSSGDPAAGVASVPEQVDRRIDELRPSLATGTARSPRRRWTLVAVAATAALALATVAALVTMAEDAPPGVVVRADAGDARLPSESAADWVTYGDHVAVVRLSLEKKLPVSEEDQVNGEGYVGRSVTMTVRKVLWTRDAAPALPASVSFNASGWVMKDGRMTPVALHDTPRLEKGHTYILALSRYSDGWAPTGSGSTLPYDSRVIGEGESEGRAVTPDTSGEPGAQATLGEKVIGGTAEDLVAHLRAAAPDPRAEGFEDLPADERWEKAVGAIDG